MKNITYNELFLNVLEGKVYFTVTLYPSFLHSILDGYNIRIILRRDTFENAKIAEYKGDYYNIMYYIFKYHGGQIYLVNKENGDIQNSFSPFEYKIIKYIEKELLND